ncbi:ankyrin repeat domain-containing protein 28 [Colletotrichum kahawae]|uniref:Ankyrin repeat domain-containing protein 28 n=1 Tax=Colletotrichum kahawae TaxID=34407 RepID=A0AAD9YL77_COLKA|nr:ankyrin repeat domain-containing protein 28 [Colletotrichum kahawae]
MQHLSAAHLCLFLLTCATGTAQADGWDDFSKNLATDLAPILALFGEQITKQFLSESTTMWDNFIFAMAPLGVITAVVSAIRVCGGYSLRAFIGRAQEGGGIAEAELCSSTSRDVCELYHNGAIVRVFGRPKILEVVHDRDAANEEFTGGRQTPSNCGIYSFREYVKTHSATRAGWGEIGKQFRCDPEKHQLASNDSTDEDDFAPNPNLSFNIGIRKPPEYFHWLAAAIAFLAQVSVLVFGGLVTSWAWKKEEAIPPAWAFPLMSLGTILLCGGMFYCAFLVENSTKERVFRKTNNDDKEGNQRTSSPTSTIYVVQPGNQVIGDQTFDPFLFDDSASPLNQYITSWKTPQQSGSELGVWLATVTTLFGFVLQFVGLRAMHSAVSVLQLGAILVVSIIRAGLRTQRLRKEDNRLYNRPDEVEGHELDWLALQMGKGKSGKDFSWVITSPTDRHEDNEEANGSSSSDATGLGAVARAFYYRSRLAELTSQSRLTKLKSSTAWDDRLVPVRQLARQLKRAIESSVRLFPALDEEFLSWTFYAIDQNHAASRPRSEGVSLHLPLQRDSGRPMAWDAVQQHLEAMIGLWTWSIISDPRTETDDKFKFKVSKASEVPAFRIMAIGATPEELELAKIDMQFWTDDFPLLEPKKLMVGTDRVELGPDTLWETNQDGAICKTSARTSSSSSHPSQPLLRLFGWQFEALPTFGASSTEAFASTIPLSLGYSISTACALDIYQSFLCAAMGVLDSIEGQTKFSKGSRGFCLENDVISGLVECFKESSLGSTQDAFSVILPALRYRSMLPSPIDTLPDIYNEAEDLRKDGRFKEAEKVLRWAWQTAGKATAEKKNHALEATMLELGELYRNALFWKRGDEKRFAHEGISWMANQSLNNSLNSSLVDISNRYVKLKEREMDKSSPITAQHVIAALSEGKRMESLWLISQVTETLSRDDNDRTILSWAAEQGWPEIVKAALELGSQIDYEDKLGRTPLSYAAKHGRVDVVRILMKSHALPMVPDLFKRTPLSYAAAGGHVPVMGALLDDPRVTIRESDENADSALHWAAKEGHEDAIKLLLKRKAPIDVVNKKGHTPLIVALLRRRTEIANCLVNKKADTKVTIGNLEAWKWAIMEGEWACAEFLLRALNEEDQKSTSSVVGERAVIIEVFPENWSSRANMTDFKPKSQTLVTACIFDENGKQAPITMNAVQHAVTGHYGVEAWLSEEGSEMPLPKRLGFPEEKTFQILTLLLDYLGKNVKVTEAVVRAAAGNLNYGKEMMALLLDQRGDQITITEEVVKAAAGNNYNGKEVMALLLDRRGDQITITEEVVKAAATCGQDQVLNFLSEQTVCIEEKWRSIAQFYNAAKAGDVRAIDQLIQKGVKPDMKNIRSETPLWIAACLGHNTVVELLAQRRDVDVNSRSVSGRPPVFWSASCGYESIVAALMDAGADPTFVDCDGNTAIDMARKSGYERIAQMLEGWNNETDAMPKA